MNNRPNIVLISVDCLRYDRCGFSGHHRDTSPNIDQLASESLVFTSAMSPGPRTAESVPGFLSGRLSADCDYIDELSYKAIPEDAETLATYLSDLDYYTLAAIANPQLSPVRNFNRGFDEFVNLRIKRDGDQFSHEDEQSESNKGHSASLIHKIGSKLIEFGQNSPIDPSTPGLVAYRHYQKRTTWPTVEGEAVISELVDRLPEEEQFFAWTHINDIHCPIHPDRARSGGLISDSDTRQYLADGRRVSHQLSPRYELAYDSIIRYVDDQIGRVIDHLKTAGVYDETVIILTADHGEALHDRGIYGHAAGREQRHYESDRDYLYRELLHVPLLIKAPDLGHEVVTTPYSTMWLHQIIADLIDAPTGDFPRSPSAESFLEADDIVLADALTSEGHTVAALNHDYKIITDGTTPESIDSTRWHSISRSDQGERTLSTSQPETLVEAAEKVITDPKSISRVQEELTEGTKKMLSDLGYH